MSNKTKSIILTLLILWLQFSFSLIPNGLASEDLEIQSASSVAQSDEAIVAADNEETDEESGVENAMIAENLDSTHQTDPIQDNLDESQDKFAPEEMQLNTEASSSTEIATASALNVMEKVPASAATAEAEIATGDATASAELLSEVNTNINSSSYLMTAENVEAGEEIDFSGMDPACKAHFDTLSETDRQIFIENYAAIENIVNVEADTGGNIADGSISSGNAEAEVNIFNLINTNLIGECWYFGVFNFVDAYSGEIVVPYEDSIINHTGTSSANTLSFAINNSVSLDQNITAAAETGGNELSNGGEINTGGAASEVEIETSANTNIIGSNWLLLEIRNPQYWKGAIEGVEAEFIKDSDSWYYWYYPEVIRPDAANGQNNSSLNINIANNAEVLNDIAASANTGGNISTGQQAVINTGEANSSVSILNFINTNIIGSSWYYLSLNLFEDFTGTIIFPRADVILGLSSSKAWLGPGEELEVYLNYANLGREKARNAQVELTLPPEFELVLASMDYAFLNNQYVFSVGEIGSQNAGTIFLKVKIKNLDNRKNKFVFSGKIGTSTKENDEDNNSAKLIINYFDQAKGGIDVEKGSSSVMIPENEIVRSTQTGFLPQSQSAPAPIQQRGQVLSGVIESSSNEELKLFPGEMCFGSAEQCPAVMHNRASKQGWLQILFDYFQNLIARLSRYYESIT